MIEIVSSELRNLTFDEIDNWRWVCDLEVEQESQRYAVSATAPPELAEGELQAHFEAMEDELWAVALAKGQEADVLAYIGERELIKAFVLVVLDEVNLLRDQHGLSPRTAAQLKTAIKNKLREE